MKGIILAGGLGTRLMPLTSVTNKHLLPVYDQPMCLHVIRYFYDANINDIMLVTGKECCGDFTELLGSGKRFGVNLCFCVQEEANGIAGALRLGRDFAQGDSVVVALGDNLLENGIKPLIDQYYEHNKGAMIFAKEVPDPHRFGVVTLDEQNRAIKIIEKPKNPETNLAVIGVYIYDYQVFDIIDTLKPSTRGELEITDVNCQYMEMRQLRCGKIEGWWQDTGTIDSLYQATLLMYQLREKQKVSK